MAQPLAAVDFGSTVTDGIRTVTTFVPKLVAVGICLLLFGSWMITQITVFTTELYERIPDLVRGG